MPNRERVPLSPTTVAAPTGTAVLAHGGGGRQVTIKSCTATVCVSGFAAGHQLLRNQCGVDAGWLDRSLERIGFDVELTRTGLAITGFDGASDKEQHALLVLAPVIAAGSRVDWVNDRLERWSFTYDGTAAVVTDEDE